MPTAGSFSVAEGQLRPADGNGQNALPLPQQNQFGKKEWSPRSPALTAVALMRIIERLDGLVDQENAILRDHKLTVLEEHNQKKSLGLLEMRRTIAALRNCPLEHPGVDPRPAAARLREKLLDNLSVLRTHLEAVAAIAAAIARTIEQQESDGTYSPAHAWKARRP